MRYKLFTKIEKEKVFYIVSFIPIIKDRTKTLKKNQKGKCLKWKAEKVSIVNNKKNQQSTIEICFRVNISDSNVYHKIIYYSTFQNCRCF